MAESIDRVTERLLGKPKRRPTISLLTLVVISGVTPALIWLVWLALPDWPILVRVVHHLTSALAWRLHSDGPLIAQHQAPIFALSVCCCIAAFCIAYRFDRHIKPVRVVATSLLGAVGMVGACCWIGGVLGSTAVPEIKDYVLVYSLPTLFAIGLGAVAGSVQAGAK